MLADTQKLGDSWKKYDNRKKNLQFNFKQFQRASIIFFCVYQEKLCFSQEQSSFRVSTSVQEWHLKACSSPFWEYFFLYFIALFLLLFLFLMVKGDKLLKKMILTSEQCTKHLFTGQNMQQFYHPFQVFLNSTNPRVSNLVQYFSSKMTLRLIRGSTYTRVYTVSIL